MSTPNLRDLLSRPADGFKAPPPLPAGTYYGTISGTEYGESREKKTPYVRFTVKLMSPGQDIEPSMLEGIDLSRRDQRVDFFLTEDAVFRLVEFARTCNIAPEGRALSEIIQELGMGAAVKVDVVQVSGKENQVYTNVKSIQGA